MHDRRRRPLAEVTQELVAAAAGRIPADTVIKGGKVVNVFTGEILRWDIAIKGERICSIGDVSHTTGQSTEVIDASGYYLCPGFLDGHLHVESSMVTVTQFARAVLPLGTTGIFMDPHEIANVLGMDGVRLMLEEGRQLPLKVMATIPSCVPAAPGFEDAGATFGPAEIAAAMEWPEICGLGEMMNFPGVLAGSPEVHGELRATLEAGKPITGHYSMPGDFRGAAAYAAAGIRSDHEMILKEDALNRMRLGIYAKMREGSAWRDVAATVKSLTETGIDGRRAILVSDDVHPETILSTGHLNHVVRRAISEGLSPIRAIQAVTINTAECFRVDQDLGAIAPGRFADILFLKDLAQVEVAMVMVDGKIIASGGKLLVELPAFAYPDFARNSVHLKEPLKPEHFRIDAPPGKSRVRVRAMEVVEASVLTRHLPVEVPVANGRIEASAAHDLAKVAVIERHGKKGTMGLGLVKGFGFQGGAVASTVAHDSHNLLIVGMNDGDMALAGNKLAECGGGMVAVRDGKVLALLPLPIAGLMSERPVEEVAGQVAQLRHAWEALGCRLVSPFMTMSLLSLPVLPELRLTNRGLVDTVQFQFAELIMP
ncbi:adenine deaminase Ade [Thermacetogenium phaeum DSM 12270]|uniref:Adenine deaminase n=1 Tax=Thermacetogenium phaeum (strain ATCC BAA-254 / DSM 26808 / PB) TaxID=1089553 RepID=K4LD29_THEPS|nr:adenine deaminase [Thermacetogenium phaeum]AFV10846.1 adenine deaminase Ade [Thermacetogenium phaeum DSM 12270]